MHLLRLTRLRHFCTVAEKGSIGLAAQMLHITQPALTRSIKKIEEGVGEPLFERTSQGVRLTEIGKTLLPYVQTILAEADRAIAQCRDLRGEGATRLKIGISPNFASYVIPEALPQFHEHYPGAQVDVTTGTMENLLAMLANTQLDLALCVFWGNSMEIAIGRLPDLVCDTVAELPVGVYAPAGHPLTKRTATLEDLQSARWAVPYGLSISYVFQGKFTGRGLDAPTQVLSTASLELLVKSSVRMNLLTVVPRHLVQEQVANGTMLPVESPDLSLRYQVALVTRRRSIRTPALAFFGQILRDFCAGLGQEPRPQGAADAPSDGPSDGFRRKVTELRAR
jgi:DNA-binding transcriptional LysR family regulator